MDVRNQNRPVTKWDALDAIVAIFIFVVAIAAVHIYSKDPFWGGLWGKLKIYFVAITIVYVYVRIMKLLGVDKKREEEILKKEKAIQDNKK